jgi:hypothetical protein
MACIKIENPTIFEGKVVYEDDGSPAVGAEVEIRAMRRKSLFSFGSGSTPNYGEIKKAFVRSNGSFSVKFPYEKKLIGFEVNISALITSVYPRPVMEFIIPDCSPYDCDNFPPYKKHENLVIKIPRP